MATGNNAGKSISWLLAFSATAFWGLAELHPFATMCSISFSLYFLIKLHTLVSYPRGDKRLSMFSVVAWFLGWPGLDAKAFFTQYPTEFSSTHLSSVQYSGLIEVTLASSKMLLGIAMLTWVAPAFLSSNELLAGWIALGGFLMLLHFGGFDLLAILWRWRGRNVRPIMNAPILSTSVSEFWSKRWNLAFRDYAYPNLFKPLARSWSPLAAVVGGYAFSGIVHELAISVPARAGFGLPTLYFAMQGVATVFERWLTKRGVVIRGGWRGWIWTALVTAPGAFVLFHPPFIRNVIVPVVEFVSKGEARLT